MKAQHSRMQLPPTPPLQLSHFPLVSALPPLPSPPVFHMGPVWPQSGLFFLFLHTATSEAAIIGPDYKTGTMTSLGNKTKQGEKDPEPTMQIYLAKTSGTEATPQKT